MPQYIRNGKVRNFSHSDIEKFSAPGKEWPESEGWTPVTKEMTQSRVAVFNPKGKGTNMEGVTKTPAPPAGPSTGTSAPSNAPDNKNSSIEYNAAKPNLPLIEERVKGMTLDEVEEFFKEEKRPTVLAIRDRVIAELNADNNGDSSK
jgi:hypothetical protein